MKKNIFKISGIFGLLAVVLNSCGPKENVPLVYFPDMYFPVAYDPLMKAEDPYRKDQNEIPAFVKQSGATGLYLVPGTVSQNPEGIVESTPQSTMTPDEYNAGYDASKTVVNSPLEPANRAKDIQRGKHLYELTCAACHGKEGDGQGPIVKTGAYVGVPKYADRDITIGSVHYVLTNGRNAMGSYAGQLKSGDRWRVALYVMEAFKGGVSAEANTTQSDAAVAPAEENKDNTK